MFERPQGGERAVLVNIHFKAPALNADVTEFQLLAGSAGADVIATIEGKRDLPDPKTFLGKGKVEELASLIAHEKIELIVVNHSLTPAQERNLERELRCRVLDRTGLILDIFAARARSFTGKLQVELAQLQHLSTRLVRGWTHLERQKGGIGLRGPGETQLEVDRRLVRDRIKQIKKQLEKQRSQRDLSRRARNRSGLATVALVGYTNAGKSTLFNTLTQADVYVADQLFATLDPTLRAIELPQVGKAILADTVGFISQLPHDLVEAFHATLEETRSADLLLLVVDSNDENYRQQLLQVEEVLTQIGANEVPRLEIYNKIDEREGLEAHSERDEQQQLRRVWISAKTGMGIGQLKDAIVEALDLKMTEISLDLPPKEAFARALLYDMGAVVEEVDLPTGNWSLQIKLPSSKWAQLCKRVTTLTNYLVE